jgi:hypothetical protein
MPMIDRICLRIVTTATLPASKPPAAAVTVTKAFHFGGLPFTPAAIRLRVFENSPHRPNRADPYPRL